MVYGRFSFKTLPIRNETTSPSKAVKHFSIGKQRVGKPKLVLLRAQRLPIRRFTIQQLRASSELCTRRTLSFRALFVNFATIQRLLLKNLNDIFGKKDEVHWWLMIIDHPKLVKQLRLAYSAEKAAAFAYVGHARSVKDPAQKVAIKQIEMDEWGHREMVLSIMQQHGILVSQYNEVKYHVIGRFISLSCYVIGWFMPYYFAGRLESGNVCEYFVMMHYFNDLGITDHDDVLYEMGMKEKEHEVYFLKSLENNRLLPLFEKIFGWGNRSGFNDIDLENKYSVKASKAYCQHRK